MANKKRLNDQPPKNVKDSGTQDAGHQQDRENRPSRPKHGCQIHQCPLPFSQIAGVNDLKSQRLEYRLWNSSNDGHDEPPATQDIDFVPSLQNRLIDRTAHHLGLGGKGLG